VVSKPFVLVQLSDFHLGATWAQGNTRELLADTIEWICAHGPKPDAVLVSGDLADHATDDEYELARELLELLSAPVYVLPGNHDERSALRRHFDLPDADAEPIQYTAYVGPLRLVVLDSTRPGEDGGQLDESRLAWLEMALAADQAAPTVIAMHHPPLATGVPGWDEIVLPRSDRLALARVVEKQPQVQRIVAGHLHRTLAGAIGGRSVLAVPSTYVQAQVDFAATTIPLSSERPGFAVHALIDGELASYVQGVP
jgi:3',5'-cyclic-AMP phosphodiesterase